jgi:hypothetical protein
MPKKKGNSGQFSKKNIAKGSGKVEPEGMELEGGSSVAQAGETPVRVRNKREERLKAAGSERKKTKNSNAGTPNTSANAGVLKKARRADDGAPTG